MKKLITVLLLLQIIGFIVLLSYGTPLGIFICAFSLIPSIILGNIIKDPAYHAYSNKYDDAIYDLQKEKEAYEDAKTALEHTGVLLGEILIENKEKF